MKSKLFYLWIKFQWLFINYGIWARGRQSGCHYYIFTGRCRHAPGCETQCVPF